MPDGVWRGENVACRGRHLEFFNRPVAVPREPGSVIAVIDGADEDQGVAREMGYACAHGVLVVSLRTDYRRVGDGERANLMLECSSALAGSFDELAALLWALPWKEGG